jgi:hypothetical protein
MNEVVKIGSYEDDDNYGSEKRSKHHSSAAPFQHALLAKMRGSLPNQRFNVLSSNN